MKLSGWGRYPVHQARVFAPRSEDALRARISAGGMIARGNGRSYGDSAVSPQNTVHMRHFNRLMAFDAQTGQVVAEAGVLLADIIATFLPRGWFPAVTPGTKFVTLGGMIAADVHGKNHHRDGSFAGVIDWFDLMDATGTTRRCSRQENTDLFGWTVGGMGLTGVILRAAFRLRAVETGWIRQTVLPAANLDAAIALLDQSGGATYSVAWIDCLGRGECLGRSLVMQGDHATPDDLTEEQRKRVFNCDPKRVTRLSFDVPSGLLNTLTLRALNAIYYWNGSRKLGRRLVDWDSFFYPLDAILGWNRIYGRMGFFQFQCVLPLDQSRPGLRALLDAVSAAGQGSFLAVLKRFGGAQGGFSFPMPGYTLALDFPVTARTLALAGRLDQIAVAHGGRFYLAKDGRMTAATLRASDPRAQVFAQMRRTDGLRPVFASAQSERLDL